ncbi:MAG: ABC transporter permease [Micropruina sp.]|uniref:ABC transporter permease n=1 Tax=Micropruina sp. TaxID=2737536 RepID=UPI0039E58456
MRAAIRAEAVKLTHSLVGVIATLAVVVGMLALLGGITAGVAGGNPDLAAKAGPAGTLNWDGLLAGAAQVTAVAAILGFGIVLAWMFGREFTEGTIAGLFALPVGRARIALAKLTVYALWVVVVGTMLTVGVLVLGLALGYGSPDAEAWAALGRLFILALLSAGITGPIAWIATVTRSVLAAVGCTVALVVVAQVGALAGAGGWMPFAAPALWAMSGGAAVTASQLALTLAVPLASVLLSCLAWSRLQLNR